MPITIRGDREVEFEVRVRHVDQSQGVVVLDYVMLVDGIRKKIGHKALSVKDADLLNMSYQMNINGTWTADGLED